MKLNMLKMPWVATLAMVALSAALGCSKKAGSIMAVPNDLPEVRLTSAPIDTAGLYYYSYTVDWVGFDPDGHVDHYLYVIDPQTLAPGQDTAWVSTTDTERRLTFEARQPIKDATGAPLSTFHEFHVFLIKAVDDKGGIGPYVARAFFAYTVAPSVKIQAPPPGNVSAFVTPAVRITWSGNDPDGVFTNKPVKYKFILLTSSSLFPKDLAYINPDSLRRFYDDYWEQNGLTGPWGAKKDGSGGGWDSTSAETTQVQYTNLTPNSQYLFVVIGFDEAGAYSPVFDISQNMLRLSVGYAGAFGPKITLFNEFFNYTYRSGQYCLLSICQVPLEVLSDVKINMFWDAEAPPGSVIQAFRWSLDNPNVFDDTPRSDENTDVQHWSQPSANIKSCSVGPFRGGETHFLFVEAQDSNGLKSLGIVRMSVVNATFANPLLVVDDTRLSSDVRFTGTPCMEPPGGPWPTRAEMDTFMFARGGRGWKCYPGNPSPPRGLFDGYGAADKLGAPDTFGTRISNNNLVVRLSLLAQYKHVIWMTDSNGASYQKPGTDHVSPETALRFMGTPGQLNTLAGYIKQGGIAWISGGGAAYAVSDPYNDASNDGVGGRLYSSLKPKELGPGHFMYDVPKWQGEFRILVGDIKVTKCLGRFTDKPGIYAALPDRLHPKTEATDPLNVEAPTREGSNLFLTRTGVEFLDGPGVGGQENRIIEDIDPDPDRDDEESTLDTLYRVTATTLQDPAEHYVNPQTGIPDPTYVNFFPNYVIMTYYHGPAPQNTSVMMTGFPIWFFTREEAQTLVHFVLETIWGMSRQPALAPAMPIPASAASMRAPANPRMPPARAARPVGVLRPYPRD